MQRAEIVASRTDEAGSFVLGHSSNRPACSLRLPRLLSDSADLEYRFSTIAGLPGGHMWPQHDGGRSFRPFSPRGEATIGVRTNDTGQLHMSVSYLSVPFGPKSVPVECRPQLQITSGRKAWPIEVLAPPRQGFGGTITAAMALLYAACVMLLTRGLARLASDSSRTRSGPKGDRAIGQEDGTAINRGQDSYARV